MSRVCFGDIVRDVKINIDRTNNPYDYYVAGDHMDTEELRILRRGKFSEPPEPGPAFTRVFKPGQILYGSRRTYLKKVAVADFEGVCANTTFVLETKDDNVFLQRLLPFLMYSEKFTQFSINNSKGSTNPYILFSDLAKYDFDLPPITKQRKLADLLWALNTTREAYKKLLNLTDKLVKSRFVEMFGDPVTNPMGWEMKQVGEFCTVTKLAGFEYTNYIHYQSEGDVIMIKGQNVKDRKLKLNEVTYIEKAVSDNLPRSQLHIGDVVMTYIGINIGDVALIDDKNLYHLAPNVAKISPNNHQQLDSLFLVNLLHYCREVFSRGATNTAKQALNMDRIRKIKMILPPLSLQNRFAEFVKQADKSKFEVQRTLDELEATYKSILQENLG
jgi:type I restriction enzyme S subunit